MIVVKSRGGGTLYVDGYRVRVVEALRLPGVGRRLKAIREAGWNTFLLRNDDVFLDMLTDSGVNAMTDRQLAAMISAQDSYAGSRTFYEFQEAVREVFGYNYVLPTHQGRGAENIIAKSFIKPGQLVPMNYHFTTTKAHFELEGGIIVELHVEQALDTSSEYPFKGNMDVARLEDLVRGKGRDKIAFIRMEATANLLGGQPFSARNLREVRDICDKHGIMLVLDGSMIDWNAYLVKEREPGYSGKSVGEIVREMAEMADVFYASARKMGSVRGGFIATNRQDLFNRMRILLPLYEGFFTYGGMSMRELGALAVGVKELLDEALIGSELELIKYCVKELDRRGVPVVKPPGGLGCHLDAMKFLDHVPQTRYPAGALAAALYLASGIRAMERGTLSMDRDKEGKELLSDLELVRLAMPRRTYLKSHIDYLVDRVLWLKDHSYIVRGLEWVYEPPILRFFLGKLRDVEEWGQKLYLEYVRELGET